MARQRIYDFLPDMYRPLLPAWFANELPDERAATCDNCAMCPPKQPLLPPEAYFSPDTKCCTFHPSLPNYAVGGLLSDDSPQGAEGRARIERKLARRLGVTPLGIAVTPKHALLYRHGTAGFGRARSLVCPYLDDERGACTVWKYREAVCATWFCKYNDGRDGFDFWQQLRAYLVGVQGVLCSVALVELGVNPEVIAARPRDDRQLDARELDDEGPSDGDYEASWGEWLGRERELFVACHRIVRDLDVERFAHHAGIAHTIELARLQHRYEQMRSTELPERLARNPALNARKLADGSFLLSSYGFDQTRMREQVYPLLAEFDGLRSHAEVRAAIRERTGLTLSDGLLLKLYKHRVLIDAHSLQS